MKCTSTTGEAARNHLQEVRKHWSKTTVSSGSNRNEFQSPELMEGSGDPQLWSEHTHSSSSFWQNSQASGRRMPRAFWLTRRIRSMRSPYSQPLLTSVRLLCSSSLRHRRDEHTALTKNKNTQLYEFFGVFPSNIGEFTVIFAAFSSLLDNSWWTNC